MDRAGRLQWTSKGEVQGMGDMPGHSTYRKGAVPTMATGEITGGVAMTYIPNSTFRLIP